MQNQREEFFLFSGTSHPKLAKEVADHLGVKLGRIKIGRFPDGEREVQIQESVRGQEVFVLQSTALEPDLFLMELLIIIDSLRRASAKSITAVIPYFGYARQDRIDKARVPITAKLVADLLTKAGATRVLTMDLHTGQVQGFFDIPVDNLHARTLIDAKVREFNLDPLIVVSPDIGSNKLARALATGLGVDFAIVDKHRSSATQVEVVHVIGDVRGKNVLLADDMCSTGGTLISAAKACQEKGALRIFAAVTHGLFVGDAVKKLQNCPIEAFIMSDTVPHTERLNGFDKIHTVSVAPLLAHAIRCLLTAESISSFCDAL
jgi:ribose-phosphate pyrophosphokinase